MLYIPIPPQLRTFLQLQRGILSQYGWWKSFRLKKPVDQHGNPVPWFTYPAIDFLKQFDYSDKSVFEWGAGQSTLFWSTRAKKVVSVECDPAWANYLRPLLTPNCELILCEKDNEVYISQIKKHEKFDIIVIDGTWLGRLPGSQIAPKCLKQGGMIILDNSDMCMESAQAIRDSGLTQIDFTGFLPCSGYASTTSIFFDRLAFRSLNGQPVRSVAQPNPPWPNA